MNAIASETTFQSWLRNYSQVLQLSFESSAPIDHRPTKGRSRELQILDTLKELLPTRFSVERSLVIVDSAGLQSPAFDGALVDRASWPRLFSDPGPPVVMIESVVAAFEVKSHLDKAALQDIFSKAKALRAMKHNTEEDASGRPFVTGFSYQCTNLNLSFFDFAATFVSRCELSPSLVCALNAGLFGLADSVGGRTVPVAEPSPRALPVLYRAREDSLLVYLCFLSEWAGMEPSASRQLRRYSERLFSGMECFSFDRDFLHRVGADAGDRQKARRCFMYRPLVDIGELYCEARAALGLLPSGDNGPARR